MADDMVIDGAKASPSFCDNTTISYFCFALATIVALGSLVLAYRMDPEVGERAYTILGSGLVLTVLLTLVGVYYYYRHPNPPKAALPTPIVPPVPKGQQDDDKPPKAPAPAAPSQPKPAPVDVDYSHLIVGQSEETQKIRAYPGPLSD